MSEFSSGVPVMARVNEAPTRGRLVGLRLVVLDELGLIGTRPAHGRAARYDSSSIRSSAYDDDDDIGPVGGLRERHSAPFIGCSDGNDAQPE